MENVQNSKTLKECLAFEPHLGFFGWWGNYDYYIDLSFCFISEEQEPDLSVAAS